MIGFRYAYNSFSYYGEEIGLSIERVAACGYDAIELVGEPDLYDADRVRLWGAFIRFCLHIGSL